MTAPQLFSTGDRRAAGLVATIALHLVVVTLWQLASKAAPELAGSAPRFMQWIDVMPLPEPVVRQPVEPPPVARQARRVPVPARAVMAPAGPLPVAPAQLPPDAGLADTPAPEPVQQRSADEIMQQAKRHVGAISKELKKEFPGPKIRAPLDTPQSRLVKGIALAHEMAPPKLWEAPKVQELTTGFQGTRRYRVITGNGTYCITVGPTHTATGLTMGGNANAQRLATCPKNELPATTQNYDERP